MNDKSELLQQLKIDRSRQPEPSGPKYWHLALVAVICIGATWYLTLGDEQSSTPVANAQSKQAAVKPAKQSSEQLKDEPKSSAPAQRNAVENDAILNSSGYITARRMATVSAEIMGLITEVNVEEGMTVSQGQVLARLDNALASVNLDLASARVDVLEARLAGIQANLAEAKRNHRRVTENTFSSDADITGALASMESLTASQQSAEADIKVAQLEVKRQQERLADHTIRAPFGGVVTVKNAQPGEIVAPTSAGGGFTRTGICTIVDMQSLEIEVDVNESFIGRVFAGQQVEAKLDAYPDWKIPASVIAIIPTADRAKATVQVRIKIEQADPRILPDMGVKVAFLKS